MDTGIAALEAEMTRLEALAEEVEVRAEACVASENREQQFSLATTLREAAYRLRETIARLRTIPPPGGGGA
jgi:hypothetical protein